MKNLIFLLFFLLALEISGQNTEENKVPLKGSYYFLQSPPGEKKLQSRSDGISNIGVPLDAKVYFIYEDDNYVYYKYWPYQSDKLKTFITNLLKMRRLQIL